VTRWDEDVVSDAGERRKTMMLKTVRLRTVRKEGGEVR
jgi:hypothetical protein